MHPEDSPPPLTYYLPHHAVIKEDSETTKARMVFDASCRTFSGLSLNDCLMVGPIIQDDLFGIILRLSQHKYPISADIVKMYRQVKVCDKHTDLRRILWRWTEDKPIRTFHLNTITYGMASSSFLVIKCLQEIAWRKQNLPEANDVILNDFYVNDLLTGASTVEALPTLQPTVEAQIETRHNGNVARGRIRTSEVEIQHSRI